MSDGSLQSVLERGLEAHGAGRLAEAVAAYRAVLAAEPQNFDALHLLGVVHAQSGNPQEAAKWIATALEIDGADTRALNNYGLALLELNRATEALAQFDKAAALEPNLATAHGNRANALRHLGQYEQALAAADRALSLKADYLEAIVSRAATLQDLARYTDALETADRAVALAPKMALVHANRATLLSAMGRADEALAGYDRALALRADYLPALCGRGAALLALRRTEEALRVYDGVIAKAPQQVEAHAGRGVILLRLQRYDEALASFEAALRLKPEHAGALNNKGNALRALNRHEEALLCFERVVELHPANAEAPNNRAVLLMDLGRPEEALIVLEGLLPAQASNPLLHHNRGLVFQHLGRLEDAVQSHSIAIALFPGFAQAFSDRAAALIDLERWNEAAASAGQAIALDPGNADAQYNHGTALQHVNRWDDALADFEAALRLRPGYAAAQNNRALVLQLLNRPEAARDAFDEAVRLNPALSEAAGAGFTISNQLCDWRNIAARRDDVLARLRAGQVTTPSAVMAAADAPELHRQSAIRYAQNRAAPRDSVIANRRPAPHARIRIGYVSSDFFNHATAQLMVEMFERHDRARFEIYALAMNTTDNSGLRKRLEVAIEHFEETGTRSDYAVAQRMAELEIDIAVDLKGYTKDCRPRIFAFRPAPVSVGYLGYPGTTGSPNIDYLIADSYLVPEDEREFYTEKLVRLPFCYQPNDSKKAIAQDKPSRTALGLPEKGFVFAAFNGAYKITPEMFDIWMRLLKAVPGSVLWLYADEETAKANLLREAQARGVEGSRLVFAGFAELPEHLARLPMADLFLDTFPICAHTTASDSLWAGLPLLTIEGKSFVSRVAGSLLSTIGVPELIAKDFVAYEAMALKLAREPALLAGMAGLRARIAKGRADSALFDAARYTRHIERAYETMWEAHMLGLPPQDFTVSE